VFDVTTSDGLVINALSFYSTPPYDYRDTVFKNGNFSPKPTGSNAEVDLLTLDTTTLTGILEAQLGALGAGESYQINSATFTAGINDGTPQSGYQSGNTINVHDVTTAFNVDAATCHDGG
jgi:hypothetical protein